MLSALSLRSQILAFTVALVVGTLGVVLVMVLMRSDDAIRLSVNASIDDASESLSRVISYRQELLTSSAGVLVSDFGFKQAVATGDAATVDSMLRNHGQRIDADIMVILDLNGEAVVSTNPDIPPGETFEYPDIVESAVRGEDRAEFLTLNDHIYQMVLVPLRTPRISGIAGVGFRIGAVDVRGVLPEKNIHVSFIARRPSQPDLILSTLSDNEEAQRAITASATLNSLLSVPFGGRQKYLRKPVQLGNMVSPNMDIVISDDLTSFHKSYTLIRNQILLLALFFILMAVIGSSLIAGRLTRPLAQLAHATKGFASGNFGLSSVIRSTNSEVSRLLSAFNLMSEELNEREEKIIYQATHDSLTGALNRDAVTQLIETMVQEKTGFLLIGIQISGLKNINENLGIETGDQYLRTFADRLRDNSNQDYLARQSADELALIIPLTETDNETSRDTIVEAVTRRLSRPMQVNGIGINPDFYTAVISYPLQAEDARQVWRRFSIALEHAITHNRRIYVYEEGLDQAHIRKTKILRDLKTVLTDNDGQLKLFYQPKMDLSNGRITKAEALIRWIHPELGFIPPDYFIELAEQTGLIKQVTRWVMKQAVNDQKLLQDSGIHLHISVNISASDLADSALKKHIDSLMENHHFNPADICLEITERDMMTDVDKSVALLHNYREYGFQLSIDDYGVGYSALSKLSVMPVDELKIDKSFILKLISQPQDQVIVKSTITMAHDLGLRVVAEGVEDQESLNWLIAQGCDFIQGYFISKALPVDALIGWYRTFTGKQEEMGSSWNIRSI